MKLTTPKILDELVKRGFAKSWTKERRGYGIKRAYTAFAVYAHDFKVAHEVYGKTAVMYFYCGSAEIAKAMANVIREMGGEPNFGWCKDDPKLFELEVRYFKGWHHWE